MSVTDISSHGPTSPTFIRDKYIQKVLTEEGEEIFSVQDQVNPGSESVSKILGKRKMEVTGTELNVTHALQQRFIDMRYINGRKQKRLIIHNSIIYGHFNNIVNRLAYGFTEDIRQHLSGEYNVKLTQNG